MSNDKQQSSPFWKPRRFWIIGAGWFGRIAVDRISRKISGATITVVDSKIHDIGDRRMSIIRQDGIQWLGANLIPGAAVDMIVPAIPVHVAAEWLKYNLKKKYTIASIDIPERWASQMPHPMRGGKGRITVSHADFICPDNCPEPEKICTHTKKSRPMDMFRLLVSLNFEGALPVVLRSHQLLPGVGGIYPADLWNALDTVSKCLDRTMMIATACRCHGVVDFMRVERDEGRPFP